MAIKDYSQTPASNTLNPEGMAAAAVNNNMRQMQADIRVDYDDPEYRDRGHTPVFVSWTAGTKTLVVKVEGSDVTSFYKENRGVKVVWNATNYYGYISTDATFSTDTTITMIINTTDVLANPITSISTFIFDPEITPVPVYHEKAGEIGVTNLEYFYGDANRTGADDTGVADSYSALNNAHTYLTSLTYGRSLKLSSGTYKISTNLTINQDVSLVFEKGAVISIDSGITLTINGNIIADTQQIFTGLGTVLINNETIKLPWFSTGGDGSTGSPWTGWETRINHHSTNSKKISVYVVRGTYTLATNIVMFDGWTWWGDGHMNSIINGTGAIECFTYNRSTVGEAALTFRDFRVKGDDTASLDIFRLDNTVKVLFENMNIRSTTKSCIKSDSDSASLFVDKCILESFGEYGVSIDSLGSACSIKNTIVSANAKTGTAAFEIGNVENIEISNINANGNSNYNNLVRFKASTNPGRIYIHECYSEALAGTAIVDQASTVITHLVVENCQLGQANVSNTIDLSNGGNHSYVKLKKLRNGSATAGQTFFNQGTTLAYDIEDISVAAGKIITVSSENLSAYQKRNEYKYEEKNIDINPEAGTFSDADATPSILNGRVWKTGNTGATTITQFDDGIDGQKVEILCLDANTTVANNANIQTNTGASKALTNGQLYEFRLLDSKWREI